MNSKNSEYWKNKENLTLEEREILEETAKYSKNNKKEEGKYRFCLIFGFFLGSILPITSLFLNSKSKSDDSIEKLYYELSLIFFLLSIPFIFYGLYKLINNEFLPYLLTLLFLVILFCIDFILLIKCFMDFSGLPIG